MALIKRGNIWHVRAQVAGVMIAKSTKTSNERTAKQLEAKWINEVHSEVVVAGRKPITLEKAIAAFLEQRRGTAGYSSAEIKFRAFTPFLKQYLHEIKPNEVSSHCRDLVDDEGYAVNTINVSIIYYNALQNFASKSGLTPGAKIKRLKGGNGRVRFLSDLEVDKLLAALDPNCGAYREKRKAQDNLDFTIMLLHTGARENEIGTMKLSQINQEEGTITINRSKGGTDTTLRMSKAVIEVVARRMVAAETPLMPNQTMHGRTGLGYLFPERSGGRYNNEYLAKAALRAGLKDVTCHVMRHTFACKMLRAGLSIVEIQHLLGHKNLSSTQCYLHLVPQSVADRATAVLNGSAATVATPD
jgi:integrase